MSIEVKNVTKNYGEQKALNDVSISIKPGEIVGFLGPNGAYVVRMISYHPDGKRKDVHTVPSTGI